MLFKSPLFNNPSVVRSLLWILMIYHSIFFIFFVVQSINNGLQMIELKIMLYFCVWLRCKMAAWCFIYTVHVLFLFVCASFITFFCCIIIWFLYSYTIPFCFCCVYYGDAITVCFLQFVSVLKLWIKNEYFIALKWHKQWNQINHFMILYTTKN